MVRKCEHLEFAVHADVNRLTSADGGSVSGYAVDITINCAECGLPFAWLGLPNGLSPMEPRLSFDGLELRAPIMPAGQHIDNSEKASSKRWRTMTNDDEQRAMANERLRWSLNAVRLLATPGVMAPEAAQAIQDVLAEVERQRAEIAAQAEREAAWREIGQEMVKLAEDCFDTDDDGAEWLSYVDVAPLAEEARALLASTGDGESPAKEEESE